MQYRHYNLPVDFPCMLVSSTNGASENHFHNCIELGFCKHNNSTITVNGINYVFHKGDYCFIPENTAHCLQLSSNSKNSWEHIFFDPFLLFKNFLPDSKLDALLSELTGCFKMISENTDSELHFLMTRIFSELNKKEPYYQDSLKGLFISLLMLIARDKPASDLLKSDFDWLYSATRHIRRNYYNKLTIAEIADTCCGLSESHFRKKFTQIMQISPLDYINQLRIRIACQLIYNNEKPISEIASEVGFTTISSFNRNFLSLMGCSPSEWRKQFT